MGTTAEKLTYLNNTKGLLKDNINLTGAGLTNQTPFREYATDLKTALLNILNNGIDTLYNNFPKTTGTGTNITLNNTLQAPIRSVINGDTEQNGEPTPTTPIEIQNVTGLQKVSVSGKNLFNKNAITSGKLIQRTDGTEVINASYGATDYIPIKENTTITLTNFNVWYTACYDKNKSYIGYMENHNSMTTLENTAYIRASLLLTNLDNAQIEYGSTATEYEPYQSQEYDINLGKNVLNLTSDKVVYYYAINYTLEPNKFVGVPTANWSRIKAKFSVEPNTDYTFSSDMEIEGASPSTFQFTVETVDNVSIYSGNVTLTDGKLIKTFNTGNNSEILISFWGKLGDAAGNITKTTYNNIQLEKGTQFTSYSLYFTPIHLYENDQIIGTPDNWSIIHNKVENIIDGTSYITYESETSTPTQRTVFRVDIENGAITSQYLSNRFIQGSTTSNRLVMSGYRPYISLDNTITGINTSDTNTEKINKLKTWLSTNNVSIVFALGTPTTEAITNTELIEQLNNFYNDKSYNGQTNISVEGDLPMILDVSAIIGDE